MPAPDFSLDFEGQFLLINRAGKIEYYQNNPASPEFTRKITNLTGSKIR